MAEGDGFAGWDYEDIDEARMTEEADSIACAAAAAYLVGLNDGCGLFDPSLPTPTQLLKALDTALQLLRRDGPIAKDELENMVLAAEVQRRLRRSAWNSPSTFSSAMAAFLGSEAKP